MSSGQLQVSGTLDTPDPETATIELFANPVPDPGGNLTGYGEGAEYIGEAIPSSDGSFDATFSAVDEGTLISATATDAAGNTSEFALNIAAEGPEPAPTIPALLVPEQGAIDQSTELTLQWGAAENSQNYRVQVDDDIDFSSPLVDETLPPEPEPNLAVSSLTVATTYYWRVRAANAGGESDWSAPGSFTTVPAPPAIAPTLVSPAQGSRDQARVPTLEWGTPEGATTYAIQLDDDTDFTSPVIDQSDLTETSLQTAELAFATTYYWRVRAANAGGVSDWSAVGSFTTSAATDPTVIVVTTTTDVSDFAGNRQVGDLPGADGLVTLREAILAANNTSGPQSIAVNIPTTDPGYDGATFTISPTTELPDLTDDGTTIDGSTQTDFTGNSNPLGPEVVIDGGAIAKDVEVEESGLTVRSNDNVIHSLVINGYQRGILIEGLLGNRTPRTGNTITGCFVGLSANGKDMVATGLRGLYLSIADSNRIGGPTSEERNVIVGNFVGIQVLDSGENLIQGNYIGTDASGSESLGSDGRGVEVRSSDLAGADTDNNRIIGNLISGNGFNGITLRVGGTQILGNKIGTNANGEPVLGNGSAGIGLLTGNDDDNLTDTTIGGLGVGEGNLIADNLHAGIRLRNFEGVSIRGNVITGNTTDGVHLAVLGTATRSVGITITLRAILG